MMRLFSIALLGVAVGACSSTIASKPGDVDLARAQLLAIADNAPATTFEGLDTPRGANRAICGRMNDPGTANMPVRFFLEPVGKRVLLDPASSLPVTHESATAECKRIRRDRSATHEAREAVCRPANVLRREAELRRPFDKRFAANCG